MATNIEEKLWVLQEKLKETDSNLTTCIVLLQQYLRQEQQTHERPLRIVSVAVLAVALAKEAADKKSKRGLFDLGYGYSAPGAIIPAATTVLRTAGGYAAPLPALSYASPAVSYAAPAVSYAAPAVSYAAPPLSYAAVGYSASAPVSYISSSAPIAVPSSAAPAVFARSSSSLLGYNAPAPLLARSVLPSPLSFGYSSARTLIV